jgi:hypothetical protein
MYRPFVYNVTGVQRSGRLKQQNPAFFLGYRTVLDSMWHHDILALFDPLVPVAEFHAEASLDDEEHFVFVVVMVKYELSFKLVELHVLAVEFCTDIGLPVFGDFRELLSDVDFGH